MMEDKGVVASKKKFSLYADLLDATSASATGTISGAPVSYERPSESNSPVDQDDNAKKQQALAGITQNSRVRY